MRHRTLTFALLLAAAAALYVCPRLAAMAEGGEASAAEPQRRRGRARVAPRRQARPRVDYTKFNHARPEHQKSSCDSCHTIPALGVPGGGSVNPAAYDVRDYPGHDSCIGCHRQQFFRGARPAICSNCHTVVSPRADARFPFPKANAASQFDLTFPHASHVKSTSLIQFKRLTAPAANLQATCAYCHKVNNAEFKAAAGAPADAFVPRPGTFMTTPSSHQTCFACHFEKGVENREQPPLANECAKCHNVVAPAAANAAVAMPAGSGAQRATPAAVAAHPVPAQAWPERVVQKFPHEVEAHKKRTADDGKEAPITCVQCHTAVRKAATLADLRRDGQVKLLTCSSSACHTAVSGTAQLRLSLYRELGARGKDAKFDCALCHTPPQSLSQVPCGHYAAVYAKVKEEARKRAKPGEEDAEVERRTKGIMQLTPEQCRGELK